MDLDMPVLDGIEAIRLIHAHDASIVIVVISGSDSSEYLEDAFAADTRATSSAVGAAAYAPAPTAS